jgi:hypothetical protein
MNKYYITFGQKYRREIHPSGYPVHPDGWVEIEAHSETHAREIAIDIDYACIYHEGTLNTQLFPMGCLFKLKDKENI